MLEYRYGKGNAHNQRWEDPGMEHQYVIKLNQELKAAQQRVIDMAEYAISDEALEELRQDEAVEQVEWVEAARSRAGKNGKLDYSTAEWIFDELEIAGGEKEYDYTEKVSQAEEMLRDAEYTLGQIEAFIKKEAEFIISVDSSKKSISTYLTVKIDGLEEFENLGDVWGRDLESYIEARDNGILDSFEDEIPTTFIVRLSDHEPGGRFGDYGRIDDNGGDIEIDVATLR